MASKVDKRVVQMNFDNKKFEQGVQTTLNTIAKLKSSLKFDGVQKSLKGLEKVGGNFNLSGIESSLKTISNRFTTFGIMGTTAIQEITRAAMNAGDKILHSTFGQIFTGGKTRALNIEQAKFMFEGLGIDVEKAMESANLAVKGTAYGLDQAAKAAGQFGASGMTAGNEMTSALRAIAGVAAMTSSEYDDIAQIFTAVSGQGRLMGDQLLQLSGRGINAAATLSKALGKSEEEIRALVSEGAISFELFYKVMDDAFGKHATKANKTFTGALSNMKAALSRIGADVATPAIESFRKAINALTPVIDNVRAALGPLIKSIGNTIEAASKAARVFLKGIDAKALNQIGKGLNNLYKTAGNVFRFIGEVLTPFKEGLDEILPSISALDFKNVTKSVREFTASLMLTESAAEKFKMIGGSISNLVQAMKNIASAVISFVQPAIEGIMEGISPLRDTLKDIIPGGLIQTIYNVTDRIRQFTEGLKLSDESAEKVKSTFKSVFTVFSSGLSIVTSVAKVIAGALVGAFKLLSPVGKIALDIFKALGTILMNLATSVLKSASSGIEGVAKAISDFVNHLKTAVENSNILNTVTTKVKNGINILRAAFENLSNILSGGLSKVFDGIIGFFDKITGGSKKASAAFHDSGSSISETFSGVGDSSKDTLSNFTIFFNAVKSGFGIVGDVLGSFFKLAKRIMDEIHLDDILNVAHMVTSVKVFKSIEGAFSHFENATKGVTNALNSVAGALKQYQKDLKADVIKKIAVSVALLAGSIVALSLVDINKVWSSFGAITGLLTELVGVMKVIDKLNIDEKGITKVAAGMVIVATSLTILASAMQKLQVFEDVGDVATALLGMAGLITGITIAMKQLIKGLDGISKDNIGGELIKAGTAMIVIATALNILASACTKLAGLNVGEIVKGSAAIIVLVAALSKFKNVYGDGAYAGLALTIMAVSTSMLILHKAIVKFAQIPLEEMNTGIKRVRDVLAGLFIFLKGLENADIKGVASTVTALAVALNLLMIPIKVLGSMDLPTLIQGLIATGVALLGFTAALQALDNTSISGGTAAAILLLSVALTALTVPITILGSLPLATVALGITAVVAAVVLLGGAMAILSPLATGMMAVAAAFALFGGAIALLGGGILAFAAGLTILTASVGVTVASLTAFIAAWPQVVSVFSNSLSAIAGMAPAIGESLKTIGTVILNVLGTLAKELVVQVVEIAGTLVRTLSEQIIQNGPVVITAVGTVIRSIIQEIIKTIPLVVQAGVTLITEFAKGFAQASGQLIKSGVTIVKNVLNGIRQVIPDIVQTGVTLIVELLKGMEKTIPQLIKTATTIVKSLLKALRDVIPDVVETGFAIINGLLDGIRKNIKGIVQAAIDIVTEFIDGVASRIGQIIDSGMNLMISFIEGLAKGIDENGERAVDAVFKLFESIVKLIIKVITKLPAKLLEWGKKAITGLVDGFKTFKEKVGPTMKNLVTNVIEGIKELPGKLLNAGKDAINGFINGVKEKIGNAKDAVVDVASSAVDGVTSFLGIHSPSRVFKLIGNQTVAGFVKGVVESTGSVVNSMKGLSKPSKDFAKEVTKNMVAGGAAVKQFYKDLKDNNGTKREFNKAVKDMAKSMNEFTKGLYYASDYYQEDIDRTRELAENYKKLQQEEKNLRAEKSKSAKEYKKAQAEAKKSESKSSSSSKKGKTNPDDLMALYESRRNKGKDKESTKVQKATKETTAVIKKGSMESAEATKKSTESKKKSAKEQITADKETANSSKKAASTKKSSAESEKKSYETATKNLQKNLKEQEKARKEMAANEKKIIENQKKALLDWQAGIKDTMKSYLDLTSMDFDTGLDLNASFEIDDSLSSAEALLNSTKNLNGYKQWLNDLKKLSEMGYDAALVQSIKDAGYQNQTQLKALLNASDAEIAQFNKNIEESQKLSADKLIEEAKTRAENITKWSENIQKMAAMGFSQGLIQSLVELGPEASAETVKIYAGMTETQVKEINKWEKTAEKGMVESVNTVTYATAMAGKNGASKAVKEFVNGFGNGVDTGFEEPIKKATEKSLQQIGKATSKAGKKHGKNTAKSTMEGFVNGINEEEKYAKGRISIAAMEISTAFSTGFKKLKTEDLPKDTLDTMTKMFSGAAEWTTTSVNQIMFDAKRGYEQASEYAANMDKLLDKGFNQEVIDKIATLGPEASKEMIAAYLSMTETQVQEINKFEEETAQELKRADAKLNSTSLLSNAKKDYEQTMAWAKDLEKLKDMGFNQEIIDDIVQMGVEGSAATITAYLGMTETQVAEMNKYISETNKTLDEAKTQSKATVDGILSDAKAQYDEAKKWAGDLQDLANMGFSSEIIDNISKMGAEASAETIKAYKSMTKTEIDQLNMYTEETTKAMEEAGNNRTAKLLDSVKSSVETYVDILKVTTDTGVKDVFKEFNTEFELTSTDLLKNMQSQAAGMKQWRNDLNALAANGLAPEIIAKLREMGPESAEQIQAFKNMTLAEIQAANTAMKEAVALSADEVLAEQKKKTEEAIIWSENMAKLVSMGIHDGILAGLAEQGIDGSSDMITAYLSMTPEQVEELNNNYAKSLQVSQEAAKIVQSGYAETGSDAVKAFAGAVSEIKDENNENQIEIVGAVGEVNETVYTNTTTRYYETGRDADIQLADALIKYMKEPREAAEKVGSACLNGLKSYLNYSNGQMIASNIISGIVEGMNARKGSVISTAQSIAWEAIEAAKEVLDINSPSGVFEEIGEFTMMGMANGISKSGSMVVGETKSIMGNLVDRTKEAIKKSMNNLENNIDMTPTITPVINMDKAMADLSALNAELTKATAKSMETEIRANTERSRNTGSTTPEKQVIENNFNMTQNNYSPKALSRIDIYRQTKNQFSQLKSEVTMA